LPRMEKPKDKQAQMLLIIIPIIAKMMVMSQEKIVMRIKITICTNNNLRSIINSRFKTIKIMTIQLLKKPIRNTQTVKKTILRKKIRSISKIMNKMRNMQLIPKDQLINRNSTKIINT
jgi:hypothetical protein